MHPDPAAIGSAPFLEGGGEAARLILARDWSMHPLGPPGGWSDALQTALSLVLNSPESMILAWGPELFFFFNDAYFPMLGPRLSWAMGARFDAVWADGMAQARPIIDDAMAGRAKRFVNLPWKLATDRGAADTWWTFSYSRILDREGRPAGLFIVTNETTDSVVGEAERKANDTRNRQILDSATDFAIIATGLDGKVTRWNEGARRVFDWTEEEMVGDVIDRIFTPEDLADDRPKVEMRMALETGRGIDERWHLRKGGERFWSDGEMTPLRDGDGAVVGFVKVLRDRTDRRLLDEALRQSQEDLAAANARLRQNVAATTAERDRLWETSPDLLLVIDFAGTIKRANSSWETLLGYHPEELIGRNVNDFVSPDDAEQTADALEQAARDALPLVENRYVHKDGSIRWFSWAARPAGNEIYATGRHITDDKAAQEALRQTEEQLRQSQKVEAVGQLTGGVAHDFNNLLTVIRGSIDLLRRPNIPPERRDRYLAAISDTTDRATKLTGQLLAFARRQTLKPEIFDAGESTRAIVDMVRTLTGSRIAVTTEVADGSCLIDADRSQFDTAIVNMAVNARDAMAGSGTLAIRIGRAEGMPPVRAHPFVPGSFVTIALTDTGSGIAADRIDRIFEPFFTTKEVGEGTGLGLSQVFGFAKQSGGDILVESEVGEGSTFTLYLPRSVDGRAPAGPNVAEDASAAIGEGACVLVVEDNPDVGTFATQALAELGYTTVLATDGAAALTELATVGARFDIVFSDVVMPGMSGIDLGREIRRLYPDLPVVLASGYSSVLAESGTHGFELLHKPYSIDGLSRVLRKLAGGAG